MEENEESNEEEDEAHRSVEYQKGHLKELIPTLIKPTNKKSDIKTQADGR